MPLPYQLKWNAVTHPGLKRNNNEDCFVSSPETGLWLVADGMGGHEAGEVASAIVCDTLNTLSHQSSSFSLSAAIQITHQKILDAAENGIGAIGMGSTVVALLSHKKNYQVAWVGDSRAYLWTSSPTGGELSRLTRDHSYVQMLLASGSITASEVESHPEKHVITQCLGIQEIPIISVDVTHQQWQQNQWVILCSDGLSDELSDEEIAEILTANTNSLDATNTLLDAALQHGGRDNITLQIIESPIQQQAQSIAAILDKIKPIVKRRFNNGLYFVMGIAVLLLILLAITFY